MKPVKKNLPKQIFFTGLKTLGLATSIVGLTGYGLVKLASWPLRKGWNAFQQRNAGSNIMRMDDSSFQTSVPGANPFFLGMIALGAPAVLSVIEYFNKKALKRLNKSARVAEAVMEDVRRSAEAKGHVISNIGIEEADSGKLVLTFTLVDVKKGDVIAKDARCKIYLSDDALSATSVHAYYELSSGKVVDVLVVNETMYKVKKEKGDDDDDDDDNDGVGGKDGNFIDVNAVDVGNKKNKD